jgi:catechol 2,3-dioxygenase-like lactoylglutathione lyase family enzyme/predicted enzyme related to lactoylglutathione lyase
MSRQTRRSFIAGMGAAVFASAASVRAQSSAGAALPLKNLGLEHLDIVVPDTAISAKFYMQVFRTRLHQQPFQGNIRFFILLGDLPANRQVGYIAIGAGGNRPTSIGHYCALAETYNRDAVAREMEAAGYKVAQGGFGMWPDPDGLELQLFQPPAGLVTAAVPSDLPVETNGLVTPLGLDHVMLNVRDIDKSLPYYHFVYGKEVDGARQHNPERLWLNLKGDTRIGLQQASAGQAPLIEHFCIKVRPFDREAVTAGLKKIGAEVLASPEEPGILRFRDNNRIMVELKAA